MVGYETPTVTPCLWFDGVAEEAARFYAGLLPGSRVDAVTRAPAETPAGPAGMILTVAFTLMGRPFLGLNGGPQFPFTEAVSLSVPCETQAEIDRLWAALSQGGESGPCGWVKDRYGLSWQVVPARLSAMIADPDRGGPVLTAVLGMGKLDLAVLERAYGA
jgi:predicted 3-demethylubiquinone-9 3-methyltransferase (glyoxalase superfamily)